jgi:hypothetical protein
MFAKKFQERVLYPFKFTFIYYFIIYYYFIYYFITKINNFPLSFINFFDYMLATYWQLFKVSNVAEEKLLSSLG